MISLVTPTGDRPEAFELTRKWISMQTLQPDQWLVIDDGKIPLPLHLRDGVDYIRREPKDGEGHTLTLNMKVALPHIKGDKILIIEDDDWYGPNYISTMSKHLDNYNLVGESYARYYHVPTMRCRRIGNTRHASFCQTGFTNKLLSIFEKCLEGDPYIDARFWSAVTDKKYLIMDSEDQLRLHCSLKGLRGRKGIGTGHDPNANYYQVDSGLQYLIKWVGEDNARIYMKHVGQSFESGKLVGVDKKGHVPILAVEKQDKKPDGEKITVITCTGDRPEAFALCEKWMGKQTVQPDQWIVIDDGKTPINECGKAYEYHRREPSDSDYLHTMCLNLLEAFKYVKHDKIIIIEDDDWYHPTYIDYMNNLLSQGDLVGLGNLVFYHLGIDSFMEKKTVKQPAFSQTAFHKNIIPCIKRFCEEASTNYDLCGKGLVDVFLWKDPLKLIKEARQVILTSSMKTMSGKLLDKGTVFNEPIPPSLLKKAERHYGAVLNIIKVPYTGKKVIVQCSEYITVSIKGLPGRKGLTTHHNEENKKYKKDIDRELIKSILKNDINYY